MEFPETRLPNIYKLLHEYEKGREIHVFHSRKEAEEYLSGGQKLPQGKNYPRGRIEGKTTPEVV